MSNELSLLTLNCWGLKYVAKNRIERLRAIAHELAASSYDIISLQEIWVYSDYEYVRDSILSRLPYSKFFYSGALGAGLATFSRFPIIAASVYPYSLNGSPIDVGGGDWFVGKAAASIIIRHPVLGQVQVFNTHLYAQGGEDGPEHQRAHRLVNAWEFAKLARNSAEMGRYVLAAGDFNSTPQSVPIALIQQHAALLDSWTVSHPSSTTPPLSGLTPQVALTQFGVTADSPLNTWSMGKNLDRTARQFLGKRLDYVFYRSPGSNSRNNQTLPTLACKSCKVVMTGRVPGGEVSFSDHFGVEAVFEIGNAPQDTSDNAILPVTSSDQASELSSAAITTILDALAACYRFSRQRARRELSVFGLCIGALLTMVVGSAWLPYAWINPIFLVSTIALSWWGTTMLYQGFLYGNWECNALMNIIEELEIHRKSLANQGANGEHVSTSH